MLNRSASLAMSTSILKALPGKPDIKRHSPSILYLPVLVHITVIQIYHSHRLKIKHTSYKNCQTLMTSNHRPNLIKINPNKCGSLNFIRILSGFEDICLINYSYKLSPVVQCDSSLYNKNEDKLKGIYLSKYLICTKFFYINKKWFFIKETDTFGHIVVWTIYTSHIDHFTPQHTSFEQSAACLSVF